ncbi:PREDICTED: EF-hand calcium-binding domain-containing protein 13 [Condylura cristata]|uniref:EF-hand calcium-binding domain-containing protein 13 n=1 Tax=Condylura cristata TaxID=143302 RepID=UPI00033466E8|nr:PREDICTED: EF-hand calcium-binding domain-containing protein 13 [Condylura cristata]
METKIHLLYQGEENIELSCDGSSSIPTKLPSKNIDSKKYIKLSKTVEKKFSPQLKCWKPEHKKMYETSIFLCEDVQSSAISGGKKVRRKKNLQVQLHTKRPEIAPSSVKPSKRKTTVKEHGLCKLPNMYSGHKTSPPLRSSYFTRRSDVLYNLSQTLYEDVPIGHFSSQELTGNFMVDIGDIIFTLDELQQQYEDVSIMEGATLDETTWKRKLPSITGSHVKYKRRHTSPQLLLSQKSSGKDLQYHQTMENNDLKFKSPKRTVQTKKYLGGVDNSDAGFQEPYSKEGINFKKSLEKVEIHDSKLKPQNLKSTNGLKKSLDKSDTISIPKLQKPSERRRSSLPKQFSFKEKPTINALGNVLEAISKLQEDYIAAEELQSILPSIGITLSDREFQKIVTNTARNEDGMMKLDDFLSTLSKEQSLPEYNVVTNVIKAIDKIKNENVDFEDLNMCLQNFGIYLSKPEFEKFTDLIEVDEMNKVNFKEFIDTMMNNIERLPEKLLLSDTIENLQNLSKETIGASDLWNILSSLNRNLKKDEFLASLELAKTDGDKVQIEEFAKVVKDMCDTSRLEELKEVVSAFDLLEGDMIAGRNLEGFLRNIGIKSPKEEAEKILQSDFVSEDSMINVKDCVKALRDMEKFSNYIDFRKEALTSNLKLPKADDVREAAYILSHASKGKIGIPTLEHALEALNVNLAEEDFREALKYCNVSDNNEVDLKDFLSGIKENPHIKDSTATQLLLSITQTLQNDIIDIPVLKTLLMDNDLHAANALVNEVLKHAPEHG